MERIVPEGPGLCVFAAWNENLTGSITPTTGFFLRNHNRELELSTADWRRRQRCGTRVLAR